MKLSYRLYSEYILKKPIQKSNVKGIFSKSFLNKKYKLLNEYFNEKFINI